MLAVNRLRMSLRRPIVQTVSARWCSSSNSANGSPAATQLPWFVVQPFGSIRVDLTQAYSHGWNSLEIFPQLLHSKDVFLVLVLLSSITHLCDYIL